MLNLTDFQNVMTLEDRTGGSKVTELLRNSFRNLNKDIFYFFKMSGKFEF